jgi:hypothetical protein
MPRKPPRRGFDDFRQNLGAGWRFALFRPVASRAFRVSLEQAILLVLFSVLLLPLVDLARAGLRSEFNSFAIPYLAFTTVLGFAAWYLLARWSGRPPQVLPMLVMAAAVAPPFYAVQFILALAGVLSLQGYGWGAVVAYWLLLAWYLAVMFRIVARTWRRRWPAHALGTGAYALITIVPLYLVPFQYFWLPSYEEPDETSRQRVNAEQVFYAQHDLLEQVKAGLRPQRRGVSDVYFVGFGAYATEDVFMKEVHVIRELFDTRFDTAGRSVALINNPKTAGDTPIASATNLERVLRHIGGLMNAEEDVLVLYLTTHGSKQHHLAVNFWPLALNTIDPDRMRQMLDTSGIKWKVVIISACYSGGFVEKLRDPHTLVMTSAEAGRESFGCGALSDFTYFGQALFDVELRRTHSFVEAFQAARTRIAEREQQEKHQPSQPQLAQSAEVEQKLAALARELGRRVAAVPEIETAVSARPASQANCDRRDC